MLESFFIYGDPPFNAEKGDYQFPLVLLSYLVASFASFTALSLAQQLANTSTTREKQFLWWGGAFAMGAGIWSMHFIGMLSYKMDMLISYNPYITVLSMIIAIAFSYGVLRIVTLPSLGYRHIFGSGTLLGIGICSMHYTGMAAMEMDGDLRYTPYLFLLSVFVAMAASAAALWMAFNLARTNSQHHYLFHIAAALIMGAATCGMHYTGMAASIFIPWADCRYSPNQDFDKLAVSIATVTAIILFLALAIGTYRKTRIEYQLQYYMKELEGRNRDLDDFVHIVSHDLKEPVRSISNYTQFLLEDYSDKIDEEGRHQLKTLHNAALRMNTLIEDLQHYSQIRRQDFALEKTDISKVVTDTLGLMELQLKEKNITITPTPHMPTISCNKILVGEIFRNLITNAIKYNDEAEKKIEVGFTTRHKEHPDRYVFFVKDNGIGIPEKFHETVFHVFKRLHGRNKYGGGSGSGLAIVKQIIERHGGQIWIENNTSKGSVFFFTLSKN
ncbi:MAG: MHYT domain-containing protein [Pseudobdellovibrionaceae bacterium]